MPIHLRGIAMAAVFVATVACSGGSQTRRPERSRPADSSEAGRVGDTVITMQEVDDKAMTSNLTVYKQFYDARRLALEELIDEKLLEQEAAARGTSTEELTQKEIESKSEPVSDADVESFYNQNRARMGGQTLEGIGPQIREFLESQRLAQARKNYIDQLRAKAEVSVFLDPPRIALEVADDEPSKGPVDARVTIVEYSDFQ